MDLQETPQDSFIRHPWELARYRFFSGRLEHWRVDSGPLEILDVGAGDAWFSSQLIPHLPTGSSAVCWDIEYAGDNLPSAFDDPRLSAATTRPDRRFDLILLLDVAEHVEDDQQFLAEIVERNLKPGGHLLFSVPAWPSLFTGHDVALKHHRRYRPRQARRLLESNGLTVLEGGGLFHSLTAARGLSVLKEKALGRPERPEAGSLQWRGGALLGDLVSSVLSADGALSQWASRHEVEIPGLSWWALCRK